MTLTDSQALRNHQLQIGQNRLASCGSEPDAGEMTAAPRDFPDARLTVTDDVHAPAEVLAPLHAYALGHATGRPDHFRRAFRPTAHIEGLRDGAFHSWDLETYCALFDGPAPDEETRSRVIQDVQVVESVASATMTLQHGEQRFTDVFVLLGDADGWRIANKVYHRHEG